MVGSMSLRPGSPLLPFGATPGDEADLRRILRSLLELPRTDTAVVVFEEIDRRFTEETWRSRAKYLAELVLQEMEKDGIVPWLNKELVVAGQDDSESVRRPKETPEIEHVSSGEAMATFEAALRLPTDELSAVATALALAANERRAEEEAERKEAQQQALGQIAVLTQALEDVRTQREQAIITAKKSGASWANIGDSAGVKRDVAFKRWAHLVTDGDSEKPTN
jgi:hypothetical protein